MRTFYLLVPFNRAHKTKTFLFFTLDLFPFGFTIYIKRSYAASDFFMNSKEGAVIFSRNNLFETSVIPKRSVRNGIRNHNRLVRKRTLKGTVM